MTGQAAFRAGLLDPAHAVPDGLVDASDLPAGRRYAVYRNNVTLSLLEAMSSAFPLVEKLLGRKNFRSVSMPYVRAHPPTSPLMMFYGTTFPAFLHGYEPLSHIPYLPDAARLDLALRQSYHAADHTPFDASPLQALTSDALMDATLDLAPSTIVVPSAWPLHDIWLFNQEPGADKPRTLAQDVLITRPTFDPTPYPLPTGAAIWLTALGQGATFGTAHDLAQNAHPTFDLTASLTLALTSQAFSELHHKDLK